MVNTTLPTYAMRREIEDALRKHRIVVIVAETGSGKTTQIGQYLLGMGETAVITQPRRAPTVSAAKRVAQEIGCKLGTTVGYRISGASCDSAETDLLFCTDGLTLIRELMGQNTFSHLVLDEFHERNTNSDTLLAWAKHEIEHGADFNLVVMSATLDAQSLVDWLGNDAVVVEVPGRGYPVEYRHSDQDVVEEALAFLRRGKHTVLVFEPGKREIFRTIGGLAVQLGDDAIVFEPGTLPAADAIAQLEQSNARVILMPLHGNMAYDDQAVCEHVFVGRQKVVVSSTIAQTSMTFPGAVVVDSGLENQIEIDATATGDNGFGIERLTTVHVSQATCLQRAGRSGRTEPGECVLCSPVSFEDRPEYSVPEILRSLLEGTMLLLRLAGLEMEELGFFDPVDPLALERAKSLLIALRALTSAGQLTKLGRRMALLPVSPRTARMLIEAEHRGVLDDMMTCAAIIEQDGIIDRRSPVWRTLTGGERQSDVLAQLAVWNATYRMNPDEKRANGVHVKAFYDAAARRRLIASAMKGKEQGNRISEQEQREALLCSITAGLVDQLYIYDDGLRAYVHACDTRKLHRTAVLAGCAQLVLGTPRTIPGGRNGSIRILTMATQVEAAWLLEVAPHLSRVKTGLNPRYDRDLNEVVSTTSTWFNGQFIGSREVPDPTHAEAAQLRRDGRNSRQWEEWTDQPAIVLPDPADDAAVIPDMLVCTYGADGETGEPLQAYGVVAPYAAYASAPWFKIVWTRIQEEAVQFHRKARLRLEEIQATARAVAERQRQAEEARRLLEAAEQRHRQEQEAQKAEAARRLADLTREALALRDEIDGLQYSPHRNEFSDELYDRLGELNSDDDRLPATESGLRRWYNAAVQAVADAKAELNRHQPRGSKPAPSPAGDNASAESLASLARHFSRRQI